MIYQSFKNKFISILFLLFTTNIACGEIIEKIIIEGNERVNTETVKMFGGIKTGEDLNKNDLNKILKDLYETNFFENVNLSINDRILIITLNENPIIQNIIIN